MSKKSGTSAQVISLPTGGGALSGIGETFAPDLHTGTGNFTVPIAVPPGRGGFQPQLSLVYSTGNGNGPLGLGWSLSVPGVSRKTSKGVPRYDDAEDTFVLSGADDLVRVDTHETATRYRPRTEGFFARILHHRDADNDYWEVHSKDGLRSFYGTPEAAGTDPAVVAHPTDRRRVFAWKLTRTLDPFGNRIDYTYERDADESGPHHWDQLYLSQIRYADYTDDQGLERFLVSVTFEHGAPDTERPDPFSEYRSGFETRTRRRCERIVVRTHAGAEQIVRTYELLRRSQMNIQSAFVLAPLSLILAAPASAEVRRCDASLGWETTGGNVKGSITVFTGAGECGSSAVANRCRVRAREAIERCVRTQYERRWDHHPINSDGSQSPDFDRNPPEACVRGANIEGYSLKKDCWTKHIDDANPVRVCHNETGQEKTVPKHIDPKGVVNVSTAGDIKSALETSVCCFNDFGLQKFPNEEDVHVRLIARSSSGNDPQKQCNMRLELEDRYRINCKRIRENVCRKK